MITISNFRISKPGNDVSEITVTQEPLNFSLLKVTTEPLPDKFSVSQFAEAARITPQAVRKMIAEERIQAVRLGKQYVINRDELARYLHNIFTD